jgi:hypothetical protein
MNNELERMRKDAQFEILFRHLGEGTEKTMKNIGHDSWSQGRDINPKASEDEAGLRITQPRRPVNQTGISFHDMVSFLPIDIR